MNEYALLCVFVWRMNGEGLSKRSRVAVKRRSSKGWPGQIASYRSVRIVSNIPIVRKSMYGWRIDTIPVLHPMLVSGERTNKSYILSLNCIQRMGRNKPPKTLPVDLAEILEVSVLWKVWLWLFVVSKKSTRKEHDKNSHVEHIRRFM